jgi:hypothetical protein
LGEAIKVGDMEVRFLPLPALSVDAKALNNEASAHAYNPSGREKEVHKFEVKGWSVSSLQSGRGSSQDTMSSSTLDYLIIFFKKTLDIEINL